MEKIFEKTTGCLTRQEIQHYLSNKLDKEALRVVEKHLVDCPLCSDAIEGYASIQTIEDNFIINKDKNKYIKPEPTKLFSLTSFNRVAAAVLLLAIPVSFFIYHKASKQSHEQLFADTYKTYQPETNLVRSSSEGDAEEQTPLNKALTYYEKKEYKKAELLLSEELLTYGNEKPELHFYVGVAALENGQTEKAIEHLEIARFNHLEKYDDASWYLALARLQHGNVEEAKAILNDLTKKADSFYKTKAEALLSKLSN